MDDSVDFENLFPLANYATSSGNVNIEETVSIDCNTEGHYDQEASAPWVSSTLTPVQLSRLDFEEFGYQMPSQTLPDISSQAITSPTLDNLSGISSSINDQPLIPDERSTGCYPIFNAMSTHLQSINQGSDIAPLTYLESPKFRHPKLYPYTPKQRSKASSSKSYACLIPGCSQQFSRSDFRGNHLRKKHSLPIPKGCWANIWASKEENFHYYLAAVKAQARVNNILSSWQRKEN